MKPCKKCACSCKKYIVLQDFWLEHIKLKKGQVITEPVSPRWIQLRLISPFCPNIDIAKREAQKIAEDTHTDKPLETPNEVQTDEIFVSGRGSETSGESSETEEPKKKRRRRKKDTVIVELPEKSEMLLDKMIIHEIDNL